MDDLETGIGPAAFTFVGMDLGAAGVGIIEVAPCET